MDYFGTVAKKMYARLEKESEKICADIGVASPAGRIFRPNATVEKDGCKTEADPVLWGNGSKFSREEVRALRRRLKLQGARVG